MVNGLAPIFALLCGLVACATSAKAVVRSESAFIAEDELFPKPRFVRKQVRFWEKIFERYPSTTVVIHESNDPDRIIDVIDYKAFAARDNLAQPVPRKERDEVTKKYLKRYQKALKRFKTHRDRAAGFGPIEKRVYAVYKRDPKALARLYAGEVEIRAQSGLADDFRQAARKGLSHFPMMEEIFASYGLPRTLTRMVFVESMFNASAYSKVGASGLWQFMPQTGRKFLFINKLVDERMDPMKSTKAAAQLLALNYRELKSWPHAITAYNHGRAGMQRAINTVRSHDFDQTILNYKSPSFGFASKNFYAEFLAARRVYQRLADSGKITPLPLAPESESIVLNEALSVHEILERAPISETILRSLNPCLLDDAFGRYRKEKLPRFYEIRVPRNVAGAVAAALNEPKRDRYARR